ncbi:unnamed protein product [Polarella glacialis]|uniref:Uncharacterized protein n=1 Tax=Polarella glacialis TaxID=89957 RepID=A0A813KZE8_POLGL|nr:unnamed protein product [Polarella glacialis]
MLQLSSSLGLAWSDAWDALGLRRQVELAWPLTSGSLFWTPVHMLPAKVRRGRGSKHWLGCHWTVLPFLPLLSGIIFLTSGCSLPWSVWVPIKLQRLRSELWAPAREDCGCRTRAVSYPT